MPTTLLLTGASGRVGSAIRPVLAERGWSVRLLDSVEPAAPLADTEEWIEGSILDDAVLARASAGVDLVAHLAAYAGEQAWADILSVNIDGTERVLRAAADAGVRHVLYASTVHVVGAESWERIAAEPVLIPRPDSYYGVSKAASEALCAVYAEKHGMAIVSARIVNATGWVRDAGSRVIAFTPGDIVRLIEAVAAWDGPGHRIVWGVSKSGERFFPLGPGREIGFDPQDDITLPGDHDVEFTELVGHGFIEHPLGVPMERHPAPTVG